MTVDPDRQNGNETDHPDSLADSDNSATCAESQNIHNDGERWFPFGRLNDFMADSEAPVMRGVFYNVFNAFLPEPRHFPQLINRPNPDASIVEVGYAIADLHKIGIEHLLNQQKNFPGDRFVAKFQRSLNHRKRFGIETGDTYFRIHDRWHQHIFYLRKEIVLNTDYFDVVLWFSCSVNALNSDCLSSNTLFASSSPL